MRDTVIKIPDPLFTVETEVETGRGDRWHEIIATHVTVRFHETVIFADSVTPRTEYPDSEIEEERARDLVLNNFGERLRELLAGG